MAKKCAFNKIYIIESLEEHEYKTGTILYNDLIRWRCEQLESGSELLLITTKSEFNNAFIQIRKETQQQDVLPLIHFEVHGSTEGLILASNELVPWYELAEFLRSINITTRNKLFVSLATCFGAYIYSEIKTHNKAPFFGFIGPWGEITDKDAAVSYYEFYDELLTSLDFTKAVEKINTSNKLPYRYHFYNSEEIFEKVYKKYEAENYSPENFEKRIIHLMAESLSNIAIRQNITLPELRLFFTTKLIEDKDKYEKQYKDNFLMIRDLSERDPMEL
jgi:hypothetical protein